MNFLYYSLVIVIILLLCIIIVSTFKELNLKNIKKSPTFANKEVVQGDQKLILHGLQADFLTTYENNLLVVLSNSCPYCREIFEIFWNKYYLELSSSIQIYVLIKNEDKDMVAFLNLFEANFNVITYDNSFMVSNNINTFPSFILFNNSLDILLNTPDVTKVYKFIGSNQLFNIEEEFIYE